MTQFDSSFFRSFRFEKEQIDRYLANAWRDLDIAEKDDFLEVKFSYAYQALIKGGIALLAGIGHVKVRSVPGHHVKILEKTAEILGEPDIDVIGNAMRMKRNLDLYEGGIRIGENEVEEYIRFVKSSLEIIERRLLKKKS